MMINQLIKLLTEDFKFFTNLTIEHILISLLAISIASVLGIILGIIISEYRKFSGLILGTVNIHERGKFDSSAVILKAIRKLTVEEFPVIVCMDSEGTDLYETAAEKYREEFV